MEWLRVFVSRCLGCFGMRRLESDLDIEVRAHLDALTEENIRRGMSSQEARCAARREFGGAEQIKEQYREQRSLPFLETLFQDIRFGARMLAKNTGFACVAVLTLALGVGANTAIFSIIDAVLLRPLAFKDPSRLMVLHESIPKMGYPRMDFSVPDITVFARAQNSFSAIATYQDEHVDISGRSEPERISAARISASLFPMLGAEPALGRGFTAEEDAPGHALAILSYALWQRRFGAAPDVIGQTIAIDRQPHTIIGVMPRNFVFPLPSAEGNGQPADLWIPMAFTPTEFQDWGGSYFYSVLGRLKPGVSVEQARAEADSLARRIIDSYPAAIASFARKGELAIPIVPLQQDLAGSVRPLLLVLMAAVTFVLLIACANIATLLLSRAAARQEEIAVRTALGATRLRLLRQFFTESLVLSLAGGALGLFLAFWARDLMLKLVPPSIPLPHHVPLSGTVLCFALGVSIFSALVFGLAPAFQISSFSVHSSLRESGGGVKTSRRRFHLQGVFVTAEFALALVLLVASGLLIRSFAKLLETNPGFRPDHVLTLNVPLPRPVYTQAPQVENFYQQVIAKISNLPGVESVGVSNDLPLNGREGVSITIEGRSNAEDRTPQAICQTWVMGDYMQTMGIPLLEGRWFTPEDRTGSQEVTIVSRSAVQKFWPGRSAIGKRIRWGMNGPWETVVGVVGNVNQQGLDTPLAPHVYRPYLQLNGGLLEQDPFADLHAMNVAVRTQVDPASLTTALLAQIHSLDPDLAIVDIRTMTQVVSSSVAGPEFNTVLFGALAGLALFLSAIGIYGVLAYVVAQQTHEIGIRMSLGAKPRDVLGLILSRGARLAGMGAGFGLAAALALTRLIKGMLYGVSAMDPLTFIGVVILLVAIGLLASYIPARRATKVDPMVALRYE